MKTIKLLCIILCLGFSADLLAQDITTSVKNVVVRLNGTTSNGSIIINNNTTGLVSVAVTPPNFGCFFGPGFFLNGQTSQNITISPQCTGRWCFEVTQNIGTIDECTLSFCVEVFYCFEVVGGSGPIQYVTILCLARAVEEVEGFRELAGEEIERYKEEEGITGEVYSFLNNTDGEFNIGAAYPNPFDKNINVDITSPEGGATQFTLLDAMGHSVIQQEFELTKGFNSVNILLEKELPGGIYYLQAKNTDGSQSTQKLVRLQ